jgi:hypothetical protein
LRVWHVSAAPVAGGDYQARRCDPVRAFSRHWPRGLPGIIGSVRETTEPSAFDVQPFASLAAHIVALPPSCGPVRLVAVDGPGGAGKSTFAGRLAAALGDAQVIHTDDFAAWDVPIEWFPRLWEQVVEPLAAGRCGRYQRYDWVRRELAEWHDVPLAPVIILEGVSAGRREIADHLALTVWIETPADLRLARGIERDGEELRSFWNDWIRAEDAHFAADGTRDRADLVVTGDPSVPHDPDTEFVSLAGLGARWPGANGTPAH